MRPSGGRAAENYKQKTLHVDHCRFEELLNTNTARLHLREFSSRWVGCRLDLVNAVLFAITALIIFLLRDVVSTSYAGAVLVYALQVSFLIINNCTLRSRQQPYITLYL